MTRPQKGRKPVKRWHRREGARKFKKASRKAVWRTPLADVPYDGAPTPLRQGHCKGKGMRS